jgi:hypothetical protein
VNTVERTEQLAAEYFVDQALWLSRQDIFSSPSRIERAYSTHALIGAAIDSDLLPHDLRQFARNCRDEFRNAVSVNEYRFATAPGTEAMYGDYQGELCLHFKHYLQIDPSLAFRGAQLTGDCVSWSKRTMRDLARCYDIGHLKQSEEYVKRSATADLYSMRGHTGAGASPSRIALAATKIGILLEDVIESPDGEQWDFSEYKNYCRLGMEYGRTGFPQWVYNLNRDYGPKQVAEIETEEELLTALWNGCGVGIGSSIGVSKVGGKDRVPFLSALDGSWAHDMAICGFDDTKKYHRETLIFWDQSWGRWNQINNWPVEYGTIPEGLFCLTLDDTMKAVRGGECHALSDSHGFRPRRQATLGAEGLI